MTEQRVKNYKKNCKVKVIIFKSKEFCRNFMNTGVKRITHDCARSKDLNCTAVRRWLFTLDHSLIPHSAWKSFNTAVDYPLCMCMTRNPQIEANLNEDQRLVNSHTITVLTQRIAWLITQTLEKHNLYHSHLCQAFTPSSQYLYASLANHQYCRFQWGHLFSQPFKSSIYNGQTHKVALDVG